MADLYVRLVIAETLEHIAGVENPRILSCEVQRMEPDVRKIPELWMATATVAVSMKRDEANETPPAFSTMWRLLVQCTQSNHYAECWREVTDLRRGTVTRVHKETSEWIPQFRADVALDWGRAFQRDVRQVGSVSERDRQAALQSLKEFRAARYRVSVGELEEILEADDGMTLPVGKAFVPEPLPAARRGEDGRRDDRERSRVGGALAAPVAGRGRSRVGHEAKSQAPDVAKAVSRRQAAAAQAALAAEALSAKKYKKYHRADLVAKNHPAGTVSPKQVVAKAAKPTGTPLIEIGAEPLTQRDIDRGLGGPPGPPRR